MPVWIMKKVAIFVVIVFLAIYAGIHVGSILRASPPKIAQKIIPTQVPSVTPTPLVFATPVNLQIPKLGITTTIESVGLDAKKNMDVPKKDMDVGWYQYGSKPGEMGNAVIAGHFDTRAGTPAVFYHLADLAVGDDIIVTDEKGQAYTFTVISKDKYPVDNFPIDTVFGKSDNRYLNLITCDGVWQPSKKLYSDRLVVRTQLKS
jgi:LPXTG-site transpeptidase (sortase) family protein